MDEWWVYKGHVELADLKVVMMLMWETGEERWFEVLSPENSTVLYAGRFPHCTLSFLCKPSSQGKGKADL